MILAADATQLPLADESVDVTFGSPPYCDARHYGDKAKHSRKCEEWVEWMLEVTTECLRVTKGPVIWVAAGVTRKRNYWPACEGLMWEWYKRGGHAYRPCYWKRNGIPGSGGDQWFRLNVEYVMCFKRSGRLPWSDNTAMGHAPIYGPGGIPSYRMPDGSRVSVTDRETLRGAGVKVGGRRSRERNGDRTYSVYSPPKLANPGSLIDTGAAGGGNIGDKLAHENEAPFPEKLAEYWIRSMCPPGGTVLDPFSGSGTTAKMAIATGRRYIAADVRMSQCELTRRRISAGVQRELYTA